MRAVLRGILLLACGCSGLEFSLILDQDAPGHKQNEAAVHALQKGDAEKALQTLHKAVKRHSNAALQNSVGVALMYLAKSRQTFSKDKLQEAALHAFNQTVLLAGGSLGGKGGKGRKMQAAKGSDLEVALANQQLASRYLEASRLNRLGIQLDLQNRWEEAAVVLREAQKAAPGYDPLITSNLGTVIYKNATHRSSGWAEAAPLYERARELVERAHQDLPGNPAVMKSLKEVQRLQSSLDAWRENAGLRELPVPKELLQAVAVRGTVVCTWSGGGSKFSKMALNLRASIRLNAPHWERAFVVLSLDNETLSFLQSQGITSWLYETLDIYMTRWRLLAGLLAEGFDVLLMDTDVVFLGDPFQHFFFDADLEVMTDHLFPERDLWDEKWRDEEHINTGFMFARSSKPSLQLVRGFIDAHHSPWDSEGPSLGGGFDLFDQRIFARFVRKQIQAGRCYSLLENITYGLRLRASSPNPSVRIHSPEVIAHGASFFWLRSHRVRGLQVPPVAHANFGRNKLYFMRDRRVWFVDNLTERFSEPLHKDEYFPAAVLPAELFRGESNPFIGGSSSRPRFFRYSQTGAASSSCSARGVGLGLACQFLELTAALEVAVALGRRLILPNAFNCTWSPMWKPYGMMKTFHHENEDCTFDFFADAEGFIKRFGHLLVEASFAKTDSYSHLSKSASPVMELQVSEDEPLPLAELRHRLDERVGDVLEVTSDVLELRDHFRASFGTWLGRALFPCQWIEFEAWFYARRPDQPAAVGSRHCGVRGLDCCAVYHGWAEKLEYFTGVAWDLPCDCGVGAALGCFSRSGGECAPEDHEDAVDIGFAQMFHPRLEEL